MRAGLGFCLLTLAALSITVTLAAGASGSGSASGYPGPRNRPRTIRGFKNVALSTARGFGKRAYSTMDMLTAMTDEVNPDRSMTSLPVELFVEELMQSPELARIVVNKFVDINQDGQVTPEELFRHNY